MYARVARARVTFPTRPTVTATSPRFVLCAMGQVSSNRRMLRATPELDKTLYSLRQSCSGNLARVTRLENFLVKRCILSDHAFQRKVLLNILADRARLEVERRLRAWPYPPQSGTHIQKLRRGQPPLPIPPGKPILGYRKPWLLP